MSVSSIRSAIKTKLETVSAIGKVIDYVVWSTDHDFIFTTFEEDGRINAWQIGLSSMSPNSIGVGYRKIDYTFTFTGLYSIKTDIQSSKTFEGICESVVSLFAENNNVLGIAGLINQPASLVSIESGLFIESPAHIGTVTVSMTETISQDLPCAT